MHCCYSRKKRARARERVSLERNQSIATQQRIDIAIALSVLLFLSSRKQRKKSEKTNKQSTAKDDDDVKNDAKTYLGRKASER